MSAAPKSFFSLPNAKAHVAGFWELPITDVELPVVGARLIDVREPDEFVGELGHLPGAISVPMATLADASASWKKDDEYLLICRSGGRSGVSAQAMVRAGFTRVVNLSGGMLAWNAAGKTVDRQK
jgi:sulfur-carrier protein adenylyltransferase/sulfurtransferase